MASVRQTSIVSLNPLALRLSGVNFKAIPTPYQTRIVCGRAGVNVDQLVANVPQVASLCDSSASKLLCRRRFIDAAVVAPESSAESSLFKLLSPRRG